MDSFKNSCLKIENIKNKKKRRNDIDYYESIRERTESARIF